MGKLDLSNLQKATGVSVKRVLKPFEVFQEQSLRGVLGELATLVKLY